jgi:hypothetical protein
MTEQPEDLMAAAADNIRAFNHHTRRAILPNECIPAPDTYRILAAAELAYAVPQALAQLGDALRRSLTVYTFTTPTESQPKSVAKATHALSLAAEAFTAAAQHLDHAQAAITNQGINEDDAGNLRRRPALRVAPE